MAEKTIYKMCTIPSSGYIGLLGLQAPVHKPIALTEKQIKDTRALGFRVDIAEPETIKPTEEVEVIESQEEEVVETTEETPELPEETEEEEVVEEPTPEPEEEEEVIEETPEEEPVPEEEPEEEVEEEVAPEPEEEATPEPEPEEEVVEEEEFLILEDSAVKALLATTLREYATELGEAIGYEFDLTKNKGLIAEEVIAQTAKWEAEQE